MTRQMRLNALLIGYTRYVSMGASRGWSLSRPRRELGDDESRAWGNAIYVTVMRMGTLWRPRPYRYASDWTMETASSSWGQRGRT